jgi:hypothetical protein
MHNIKEYLSYDPLTGVFTWLKSPAFVVKAGRIAGARHHSGYIDIGYNKKLYRAHRLAWWFVHGHFPNYSIDHINEVKDDNRLCNLRLDINRENEQNNSKPQCNNTSGYLGVCWNKQKRRWQAQIHYKNKQIYLGLYDIPEEAHEAYLCAKRKYKPFWVEKETI